MNIVLDVIVLATFAVCIFNGYYRGFVKMLLNLFGGIACFIASILLAPQAADFLNANVFSRMFASNVTEKLTEMLNTASGKIDIDKLFADKPQELIDLLNRFNINIVEAEENLKSFLSEKGEDAIEFIAEKIISSCSYVVSYIIAFLGILIISTIILKVLIWVCDLVFELPILGTADTLLGIITGAILGGIFVFTFCLLADYAIPYIYNANDPFLSGADPQKTLIYKFFSQNNILKVLISLFES